MMVSELSKRMSWATERISPTREVLEPVMRSLYDLPVEGSSDGAREVAFLAAWRAAQMFAFQPVMDALSKLRERTWDPEQPFLLTDSVHFSWKTAPIRKYASFEDFYQRELEPTWGKWTDLQQTWRDVVTGRLSYQEGVDLVRQRAEAARRADELDLANQRPVGRPKRETVDDQKNDVNGYRPDGNSAEAALRRLRKDRTDLHARVLAGELTAHAAMVAAGFRKPRAPEPFPGLKRLWRAWGKATADERVRFMAMVEALK